MEAEELPEWVVRLILDAERGTAIAQSILGGLYHSGKDDPQDSVEAAKWYRLAAEQGHAEAQRMLGVMYHNGDGVPQDYAEAAKWIRIAAEQGDASAQYNLGLMHGSGAPQDYAEAARWCVRAELGFIADTQSELSWARREGFTETETAKIRIYREQQQEQARECIDAAVRP